ncbi:hypothetical protein [Aquibacillus sediminis]|uniref:hypothetical protein n=1 Tax=Aquibacillus sediminis TaxID=2574734 RepID=UPI0011082010|nr:hypothetical protein [Aquibacillus sediminis]
MRKSILVSIIFPLILILFGCTNATTNQNEELTEDEKELVDISNEKSIYKEVFSLANKLRPNKVISEYVKTYDTKPFEKFVSRNSKILQVTETEFGGIKGITIDYLIDDQRKVVVEYFEDGKVRKTTRKENILENFNDEEFTKKILN